MLQSCEATSKLVISDLGLRPVQIQSVFRALQCQNTLKELYLPGNCIAITVCNPLPEITDIL